jgi:sister chromatid cohesion protein DCC1
MRTFYLFLFKHVDILLALCGTSTMRFTDLFLTRGRQKTGRIKPYLSDIVVDTKELDKPLLKYARALAEKGGSWYMERAR